ncbi:S1/P1 nuclease [Azospira restricta]|uniref:S1/P1 nuclease n=1 Tax=Azospira restricta TaxID=404405 RepID=A0A974Y4A4_9RHOO|nr:S1/P1 nuclease [Azospira restricta]QRJ64385.1 S1/P1 nuclease [Azospira restricta]
MAARCRLRAAILGAVLLATSAPALAWNAAGHRLSAAIAWREMSPTARIAAGRLLAAHPDHAHWLARTQAGDADYAAFLAASTWPDDIKRDRRFHDDGAPPTAAQPGFPDMARHRRWHHADHRLDDGTRTGDGELDRRLPQLMRTLRDPRSTTGERSYALPWLIHLVADAHQPLHVASRHDDAGDSDEGGNGLWVETPLHPRLRAMTLHAYWDDLPGPPWLRGERLEAAASALLRTAADGGEEEGTTDVARWIGESRELARSAAYAGLDDAAPAIGERYHARAQRTAQAQIVRAGRRLARLLDALLADDVSRETRR